MSKVEIEVEIEIQIDKHLTLEELELDDTRDIIFDSDDYLNRVPIERIYNSRGLLNLEEYDLTNKAILKNIGYYYEKFEKNIDDPVKFYKKASELGDLWVNIKLIDYYATNENYELIDDFADVAYERGNIDVYHRIAVLYYVKEINFTKIVEYCLKSIEIGFNKSYRLLGLYYFQIENEDEIAEEYFKKAIQFGDEEAYRDMGLCANNMFEYKKARKYLRLAVEFDETNVDLYNTLGYIEYVFKNFEKAIECFQKSIDSNISVGDSLHYIGKCYLDLHNYSKAKEYLIKAVELENLEAIESLGQYYMTIEKNPFKADECYFNSIFISEY